MRFIHTRIIPILFLCLRTCMADSVEAINSGSSSNPNPHPLDPLTPEEMAKTLAIIKSKYPRKWLFHQMDLKEPPKSLLFPLLMAENNGVNVPWNLPRRSRTILIELPTGDFYEVIVNLSTRTIECIDVIGKWADKIYDEEDEYILGNDSRVIKRAKASGYSIENIYFCGWSVFNPPNIDSKYKGHSVTQYFVFARNFEDDNIYAHPLEFSIIYDYENKRVFSIEDIPAHDQFTVRNNNQDVHTPKRSSNYDPTIPGFEPGKLRDDLRPLKVSFPKGASYSVDGNLISWQKFKFRIGFTSEEGLIIHNVNYKEDGKVRPLFYRLSVADLTVLYGDPRPPSTLKLAFDEGQSGLGRRANSLVHGQDCIGTTTMFNAHLIEQEGKIEKYSNVICLSEEDNGILWKHTSETTGKTNLVRSRRLSLTQISTLANYDYIMKWYFYQDASIEFQVSATGIVSTTLLAEGATPFGYGTTVFPQINAQYHQHIISVRMDPMLDGQKNTVAMVDAIPIKEDSGSAGNPYGNGFTTKKTIFTTAGQSRTNVSPMKARTWNILNEKGIHPYAREPMGYKLYPMNTPRLIMAKNSPTADSVGYAKHSIWVTPYTDTHYLATDYFYMRGNGLAERVEKNLSAVVECQDIVVWHTLNSVHIPKVEDFPIMSQMSVGFKLMPSNFYLRNPALDVPGSSTNS